MTKCKAGHYLWLQLYPIPVYISMLQINNYYLIGVDYLPLILIPIGIAAIVNFTKFKDESLLSYLIKKIRKSPINTLTDIETPREIEIGGFDYISVTFQGSLKHGFLTCKIEDYSKDFNWCEDRTTVKNLGHGRQIGILNFKN